MSNNADGTYGFVYSGAIGVGIGVFVIKNSMLNGADLAGGRYRGSVTDDPQTKGLRVVFDMFVPAGTFLVQNASPQELSYTKKDISVLFPQGFDNGEPTKIYVPPGYVTLMINRIPDENSIYASGVHFTMTPVSPPASEQK
jgi:hypothetical protein